MKLRMPAQRRHDQRAALVRHAVESLLPFEAIAFLSPIFGRPKLSSYAAFSDERNGPWTIHAVRLTYVAARIVVSSESTPSGSGTDAVVFDLLRTVGRTTDQPPPEVRQTLTRERVCDDDVEVLLRTYADPQIYGATFTAAGTYVSIARFGQPIDDTLLAELACSRNLQRFEPILD